MVEQKSNAHTVFSGGIPDEARQHFHAAREELRKSIEGILPPGFSEHHRKARREMLLAWRSLIDASLERMEKTTGKTK